MRKFLTLLLILLSVTTIVACGEDNSYDGSKILEDPNNSYYITSNNNDWQVSNSNQMSAINLDNALVKDLIANETKSNIKYLYHGTVTLDRNTAVNISYNGSQVNLGMTFEIVITSDPKDESMYLKVPGYGASYESLTTSTLHEMNTGNNYCGAAAKTTGEFDVIIAEYYNTSSGFNYGIALIKKGELDNNQPTNTPNVDYNDIYDSNNGVDILPTSSNLAETVQEGLILHAWNWSYKNIENSLEEIANAGYTTVQVSPVQQPKDYDESYPKGWAEQWWKFYQPVSYSIAQKSWLGTKDDLKSLCSAADKYGIKIIADIVANHVANISNDSQSDKSNMSSEVKDYEPELYNNSSSYIRKFITNNDSSISAVVEGNIGMPDLNTKSEFVQNMIIDLLKECIDCGIDGFRFDAAKHIETPDDGSYASDFWPNVLNAANNYASSKGVNLYHYGEILNTPGSGRNWNSYTKYMSITDNVTGNNIRKAIVSKNASAAANDNYMTGQTANKLVLWAESHDTYANTERESTDVSQSDINKTWALVAARKDATALYFARPGEVGTIGTYAWKANEVACVNNFHNQFIGANEHIYSSSDFAIVERYTDSKYGAVIVNCSGNSASVNINIVNLADGTYRDEITGNTFTVSNGVASGKMGSTGIAVLTSDTSDKAPVIRLSQEGGCYSNSIELTVDLSFATSARVIIGDKVEIINETTTFTIDDEVNNLGKIKVNVCAVNESYRITKEYEFLRLDGYEAGNVVVADVPEEYLSGEKYDLYAYVWVGGTTNRNKNVNVQIIGNYVVFDVADQYTNFLLVAVKKGYSFTWANVKYQTADFNLVDDATYSAPKSTWKAHTN